MRWFLGLLCCLFCCRQPPPLEPEDAGLAVLPAGAEGERTSAPDPAPAPGPAGPFVEPPLEERPRELYRVVVGHAADLKKAGVLMRRATEVAAVPVGYPAIEQAGLVLGSEGFVVLAGKFARRDYARALADLLRRKGLEQTVLLSGPYRHDRLTPTTNALAGAQAGMVFAGLEAMEIPLLGAPATDAPGIGAVADGALVRILKQQESQGRLWYRVESPAGEGFLPASRVLREYNLFPSPDGNRAILGLSLGCIEGDCRWDYWLVGPRFSPRRLLGPAAPALAHAFSPDGKILAYAAAEVRLALAFSAQGADLDLGPGTSPSWSPDGASVYFRRPGSGGQGDEVVAASPPDWTVRKVFEFRGQPHYPPTLNIVPPPVDLRQGGARLYTMFYRLARKDGGEELQRWKVLFNPDGKMVDQKGEQLSE